MAKAAKKRKSKIKIKEKNKGKFTEWCKRNGYGGVTKACIAAGLKSDNPDVRKMANFARNARSWND